ncbi:MAG: dihydrodipicolinate synthase family protein [Gammaproteobacteria bacterium]|nr:dihydrodipicolinate synthase family protein [Gammaproteobacteria bacterium]
MMAISFRGVFPILPTPFLPDESIDVASCGTMVRRMVEFGVDGVTILGVLGEANRLTDSERAEVIEACVEAAAGNVPVVVGASHSGTKASCELAKGAIVKGAGAVMVTPHAEAVPSDDKVRGHICAIADATDAPIVLQDHPGSTGVHMPLDLVLSMVAEVPTIACIKQEALPSPPRVAALKAKLDRPTPILTGLGALYGAFELAAGADGFMTGFAFPEVLAAMVEADADEAFNIHHQYLPLIVFEGQPGVAIRKEIFRRRGLIAYNTVRAPGAGLSQTAAEQLDHLLTQTFTTTDIQQRITPGTANR